MTAPARQAGWLAGAARIAVVLLALFVPALLGLGYRMLDAEILVFASGAVVCGALLSLLTFRVPVAFRLLLVLLLVWVLDFYFLEVWYSVIVVAAALVVLAVTRHHENMLDVATLCAAIFVALNAVSSRHDLLVPGFPAKGQHSGVAADGPLLLHIVLDEQASPLTATEGTRAAERARKVLAAYEQRGFAAQVSVRADQGATETSLARVFGPRDLPASQSNLLGEGGGFTHRIQRNDLLQALVDRRYGVSVVQNSFLQLCVVPAASCHTYSRDNFGHAMRRYDDALASRIHLAATLLHVEMLQDDARGVFMYGPLGRIAARNGIVQADMDRNYWTRTVAMLELFDVLDERARSMRAGEAWMVHVLLPHFPYMLDEGCRLRPYAEWSLPTWVSGSMRLTHLMRRLEDDYWRQVECTHLRVLNLVDQLDQRLGAGNVRVLIHGDHGARLGRKGGRPAPGKLVAVEPSLALDTLVLLRAPGVSPGADARRVRLVDAVRSSYDVLLR